MPRVRTRHNGIHLHLLIQCLLLLTAVVCWTFHTLCLRVLMLTLSQALPCAAARRSNKPLAHYHSNGPAFIVIFFNAAFILTLYWSVSDLQWILRHSLGTFYFSFYTNFSISQKHNSHAFGYCTPFIALVCSTYSYTVIALQSNCAMNNL